MDLLHYVRTVRRRWRVLLAFLIFGAAAGWAAGLLAPPSTSGPNKWFVATHTLSANDAQKTDLEQLSILTTSGVVPERVAERLGGSPAALAAQVRAKPAPEAGVLKITSIGNDPGRTTQVADTFAEELVRYQPEIPDNQKKQQIDTLRDRQGAEKAKYDEAFRRGGETTDPDEQARWTQQKDQAIKEYNRIEDEIKTLEDTKTRQATLATLSTAEALQTTPAAAQEAISDANQGKKGDANNNAAKTTDTSTTRLPGTAARIALGAAGGLLLGIILVLVIDRLDPRIRTKVDAEEAFGYPVLSFVPAFSKVQRGEGVVSFTHPRSRVAEAYRSLRSALLFADVGRADDGRPLLHLPGDDEAHRGTSGNGNGNGKGNGTAAGAVEDDGEMAGTAKKDPDRGLVIMVTSPGPAEGKTTTVANLSAVFAEAGYSVFVLNCDFRRPRLHELVGGEDEPGESGKSNVPGVEVMSHVFEEDRDANPASVVAQQRRAIREAREQHDIVLLDTAPLLATNDASDILADADQVLLMCRAGKTTKEAADRAAEFLERRHAPVVGVLMTATSEKHGGYYYYYYYGSGYYGSGSGGYYLDEKKKRRGPSDTDGELVAEATPSS